MLKEELDYSTGIIHIIVWALLFLFPLLGQEHIHYLQILYRSWIPLLFTCILFYINFLILIPKLYFDKQFAKYIVINLLVMAMFLIIMYYSRSYFRQEFLEYVKQSQHKGHNTEGSESSLLERFWFRNALTLIMSVGTAIAIKISGKWHEEEQLRKQAENDKLKSEIDMLKYQIRPHFFFNTLNNIYALIDINPTEAKNTVIKLSKLMRHILYKTDVPLINLNDEIEFIKAYADVMRTRSGQHIEIHVSTPTDSTHDLLPPLMFISLVENAFKHGVHAQKPSFIHIEIFVEDQIKLVVKNSFFPKDSQDISGSGIGIQNLKQRLALLFEPKSYHFKQQVKEDTFISELFIPISKS